MTNEDSKQNKVKLTYKPAKEIVILDFFQFSKDNLNQMFARLIHAGLPVMANWAEGVLFLYFPLVPDTNDLMENYLKGRVFWSSASFSLMPKYTPSIKISGLEIPVMNVSDHPILQETAKWLKKHANTAINS
jgi:hypothetical protein